MMDHNTLWLRENHPDLMQEIDQLEERLATLEIQEITAGDEMYEEIKKAIEKTVCELDELYSRCAGLIGG